MSRCRCNDISKCNEKITQLSNTLERFRVVDSGMQSTNGFLSDLSTYYAHAFESTGNSTLCEETLSLNQDMAIVRADIASKISQKLSALRADLSNMKDEDEDYHEDEEDDK